MTHYFMTFAKVSFYGLKCVGFASHHEKMFMDIYESSGVLNL